MYGNTFIAEMMRPPLNNRGYDLPNLAKEQLRVSLQNADAIALIDEAADFGYEADWIEVEPESIASSYSSARSFVKLKWPVVS